MSFQSGTFEGKVTAATEHSRTLHHQVTAATEHSRSAEMSANVVFVNIDWKESRHYGTLKKNMRTLYTTIRDIVEKMNPTVLSMCEVGVPKLPLTAEQMRQVEATLTTKISNPKSSPASQI